MNRIAEFNAEANAVTDREHAQQLQLLQALKTRRQLPKWAANWKN